MTADSPTVTRTLFRAIAIALGLAPDSPTASARILRAYADPPPPQSPPDVNLCFFDLSPDPGAPMLTERKVIRGQNAIWRFIPCTLTLVFYGLSSESDAISVRENLFIDGVNHPLSILRNAGIYPVPPAFPPSVLYEEEGSLFRKRADLTIPVRLLDNSDDPSSGSAAVPDAPLIESPPGILLSH